MIFEKQLREALRLHAPIWVESVDGDFAERAVADIAIQEKIAYHRWRQHFYDKQEFLAFMKEPPRRFESSRYVVIVPDIHTVVEDASLLRLFKRGEREIQFIGLAPHSRVPEDLIGHVRLLRIPARACYADWIRGEGREPKEELIEVCEGLTRSEFAEIVFKRNYAPDYLRVKKQEVLLKRKLMRTKSRKRAAALWDEIEKLQQLIYTGEELL